MKELSYSEIQEKLRDNELAGLPPLNITILRNIMLEPVEPYLRYLAYQLGLNGKIALGEYDNIFQEAVGGQGALLGEQTDFVLIFAKLDNLCWRLARKLATLTTEEIQAEVERIRDFIIGVLRGIRTQTDATILWNGFDLPVYPALGILDSQKSNGQLGTVRDLNSFLKSSLNEQSSAYFVDLNLCLARLGVNRFYDPRYWHIGRAPFTREALREIALENFKFIRALKGKNKKCFVLDCDNILWGGIIGEDGLSGIKLGRTYPGSAYYEFQQEVLNLYNRGVILALCSKNNEDDVWEVFKKHPDMVLKEEHIATAQINWDDKATNVRQIAMDLNIGLDSLVFVDDSEAEVALIREVLPEVEVLHMPRDRAVEYENILSACGLFDALTLSEEDKKRGRMYKAEAGRRKLRAQVTDLTSYYESLEMEVFIKKADSFSIPRIAQLTQRTNQFNLTTKRYTEGDIKKFAESSDSDVLILQLKDRFGDYGIVGVAVLRHLSDRSDIDTFLLSCRALGRGVEEVLLQECIESPKKMGKTKVLGYYIRTKKNKQVENFYQKHGFCLEKENEHVRSFSFSLDQCSPEVPKHFKIDKY